MYPTQLLASLSFFAVVAVASAVPAQRPMTRDNGAPVGDNQNSVTAGPRGGVMLGDVHLIEKLARFDRERIPERVVHARGVAAYGDFVSAGDFSKHTKASLFGEAGKRTPVFARFSTVIHSKGSPETLRDPRGFAVKFYTDEGNWDLVGNNLPVFFIRDAIKFPDMVHSLKPSPITNRQDPNRFFDFFSHVPESTHMLLWLYSDRGTPRTLRHMDGFGVHAFKWVDAQGRVTYVKFNWRSKQGVESLTVSEASELQARDFSPHTRDLYQAIAGGDFPQWDLHVQMLRPQQLDEFDYDPLDATKMWLDVPEMLVGTMTLNRTPDNFFQETEQSAFGPAITVPGIEPSEDRLLQGRLFAYPDTQRYRIGINYLSLPVNRPRLAVINGAQDGAMNSDHTSSDTNYQPSVSEDSWKETPSHGASVSALAGATQQRAIEKSQPFHQAGVFYRGLTESARANLVANLAGDLGQIRNERVQLKMLSHFARADIELGARLAKVLGVDVREHMKRHAGGSMKEKR